MSLHRHSDCSMKPHCPIILPLLLTALLCASCKEDPKLVEERSKQKVEIARLKGDLDMITEKVRNLPPDMSADLEKARKTEEEQAAEEKKLEDEVSKVMAQKRTLQAEFDAWRAKHSMK